MQSDDEKTKDENGADKKPNPWESKKDQIPPQGPPPLDQFFKDLFKKLSNKTNKTNKTNSDNKSGAGSSNSSSSNSKFKDWKSSFQNKPTDSSSVNNSGSGNSGPENSKQNKKSGEPIDLVSLKMLGMILLVLIIIWAASGFYVVNPAEEAVILKFGKYAETTGPGPHWMPRFIETNQIVDVNQVAMVTQDGVMLTSEENLVHVVFVVKYKISDPEAYLFNSQDPSGALSEITDSVVREVIGHSELTDVLTNGRELVRSQVETQIKKLAAQYQLGLTILDVDMQYASAPDQVKDAFDDVIKAREDQVTYINNGNTYANQVVPQAKGQAARILQQADADAQKSVLNAEGSVASFNALLPQYHLYPAIVRDRMYLDTMQNVLQGSHLILIDSGGKTGNFYITLPDDSINSINSISASSSNLNSANSNSGALDNSQNSNSNTSSNTSLNIGSSSSNNILLSNSANSSGTNLGDSRTSYLRWQEAQNNAS